MLSRCSTGASLLVAVLLVALAGGCARVRVPELVSGPKVSTDAVAKAHLFDGFTERMMNPPGLAQTVAIPAPLKMESLPPEEAADPVNLNAIQSGLKGRVQAVLDTYGRNVRARELRQAEIEVARATQQMEPDLEQQLDEISDELFAEQHNLRIKQSVIREQIRFNLALMGSRSRVEPGAGGEILERQIAEKRQQLEELERRTAESTDEIRAEYERRASEVRKASEARISEVTRESRQAALERASRQVDSRSQSAREASEHFLNALSRQVASPPGGARVITGRVTPGQPSLSRSIDTGRSLRAAGRRVEQMIREDAATAARLTENVSPPSVGAAIGFGANARAGRLLGTEPLRRE